METFTIVWRSEEFFVKIKTKFTCSWKGFQSGCSCPVVHYNEEDYKQHLKEHIRRMKKILNKLINAKAGIYLSNKNHFDKLLEICQSMEFEKDI